MPGEAIDILVAVIPAWDSSPVFQIMVLLSCGAIILSLTSVLDTLPMCLGCLVSWKECVHFYDYASNRRKCTFAARVLSIPLIFILSRFHLHPLTSFYGTSPLIMVLTTAGILLSYAILRYAAILLAGLVCRNGNSEQALEIAFYASGPFLMMAVLLMFATAFVCSLTGVDVLIVQNCLYGEAAFFYLLFLLRKAEILMSYRGFFTGFLYLCTLEIAPTGLLFLSAIL